MRMSFTWTGRVMRWAVVRGVMRGGGGGVGERRGVALGEYDLTEGDDGDEDGVGKSREEVLERKESGDDDGGVLDDCGRGGGGGANCTGVLNCERTVLDDEKILGREDVRPTTSLHSSRQSLPRVRACPCSHRYVQS